ncbi:hypothetical protein GJ496_002276 [Pomphorhynchus laevis]|nr:hypothetical protein GJ496_002276 [Pomphorhynchus laevis]
MDSSTSVTCKACIEAAAAITTTVMMRRYSDDKWIVVKAGQRSKGGRVEKSEYCERVEKSEYCTEGHRHLSDQTTYTRCSAADLNICDIVSNHLDEIVSKKAIQDNEANALRPLNERCGRFYLLPKVYMKQRPFVGRQIVNCLGALTELLFRLKSSLGRTVKKSCLSTFIQ